MSCNCGNKNEGNFPPSVFQVNSAECPVLFHKVVIPTNFGDETETPVLMGEYKNALVYYEVNGHTYLYSSDGVPTRLDRGGASVLYVEELPETSKAMQDTLYVSSRGELAVYKNNDKKILNEKPTYYTTLGNNTDGAMTQKAVTDALSALSEEVKNKLAEFKNGVVDKVMPEVNEKVSGMERFVTTKIEEMKRETSTLVNTTTNDVNLMNNKLNKHIEQADIAKNDLLDKIRRNTDSITDTKNSLRNYALISDVDSRVSDAEARANNKITQAETRVNNTIGQAKTELDSKITEANGKISALDTRLTKQASDNKADITQLKANLNTTNSALLTHKEQADKKFDDIKVEQSDQDTLISDILNAFSAESDKGTNLKLNSSATKVLGMTIYGNTEQTKASGKNLVYNVVSKIALNGLRHTVNLDGSITTTGTPNNTYSYITEPTPDLIIKKGETVTLSVNKPLPFDLFIGGTEPDSGYSNLGVQLPAGQLQITGQAQTTKSVNCLIAGRMTAGQAIAPITYKAQLEYGNMATGFSYYTGGFNNLFDEFSGLPINSPNGVVLSNQDGVLKLTGKPTINWLPILIRNNLPLLDKTTYTVVSYNSVSLQLFAQVLAYKKDGSGADTFGGPSGKIFTFTTDSTKYDRYSMKLQLGSLGSYPEPVTLYNNFALFQGNYNENNLPEYSPYNTGLASPRPQLPQVVKELGNTTVQVQGKNLFDTRFGNRTIQGVKIKTYPDGSFALNGTPTNGFSLTNVFSSKSYVPAGKYKLKVEIISGSVQKVEPSATFLCVYTIQSSNTSSNSEYVREADIVAGNIKEFTNTVNILKSDMYTPYVWIPYHIANKKAFYSYKNLRMRATLVPNGENTNFVEFESQQFTLPSGLNIYKLTDDIYDEVKLENGVAKLIKRVGKLELSGEEYFRTINTENPGQFYVYSNVFDTLMKNSTAGMCTHFDIASNTVLAGVKTNKTVLFVFSDNGNDLIRIMFSAPDALNLKITDINSFKNWLKAEKAKGTPVTVYYEMKTPTEEEITDPTLLAELKKLMEMRTYKDVTNISITGTDLTPEIKVKYMRKIGE